MDVLEHTEYQDIDKVVDSLSAIEENKDKSPEDSERYRMMMMSDEEFRKEFPEESALIDAYFNLKRKIKREEITVKLPFGRDSHPF